MSSSQIATKIPTGTWSIDASHSSVSFSVRHMMVAKTRGRFSSFAGTINVADDPAASTTEVTIDASSVDTHDAKRDDHLRSPDFFDAATYPELTFRSTALEPRGDDEFRLVGDLTVRGVTRPVTLDVEVGGVAQDPWGGTRVGFTATGTLNRSDFGLEWNAALETGGVLIGDKIKVELDVEAVKS